MKLVTAIIQPHLLEAVKEALSEGGINGMTITKVQGHGRQGGHTEVYRGTEYAVEFLPKIKLEVIAYDYDYDRILRIIRDAANTGNIGDGKVWVTDLDTVMRIRTGELDEDAV